MKRTIIIATTSRSRKALIESAKLECLFMAPQFDEVLLHGFSPLETAVAFAQGKAQSLPLVPNDALVIGCDQVPTIDGHILQKPATEEAAVEQLMLLSGRTHELHTAVAVYEVKSKTLVEGVMTHQMTMRTIRREVAERYVRSDNVLDCAGAYRIEGPGIALFSSMIGADHSNIIGFPISLACELLFKVGVDWFAQSLGFDPDCSPSKTSSNHEC